MSKLGSQDPFEYLQHKLWLKERLRVKVSIWLPTIKSWESPWIMCIQVMCHISLENSWPGLQLCLKRHFNWRVYTKCSRLPKWQEFEFRKFWNSQLENPEKNDIWMQPPWLIIEKTIRGKVVTSPKSGPWWILWICVCPWFVHALKMF